MRVLELSQSAAAAYAGLLLGEYGFDVDVVTGIAPGVDAASEELADDDRLASVLKRQRAATATFLHRHKTPIEPAAIDLANYDCVIEDVGNQGLQALGLNHGQVLGAHDRMVLVTMSPFGLTGPYSQWHATDLQAQAAGGVLHASGFDDGCPRKLPGDAAAMIAGIHGATAAVATVYGVGAETVARATHIDISAQDTFMQHWTRHVADYAYSGAILGRTPTQPKTLLDRHTAPARDGWIFMLALRHPWQDVIAFLGLGEFLTEEAMAPDAEQPWADMEDAFYDQVASKDRYDWFSEAAELGWTFAPVDLPLAAMNSAQTQARQATEQAPLATSLAPSAHELHEAQIVQLPKAPVRWSVD